MGCDSEVFGNDMSLERHSAAMSRGARTRPLCLSSHASWNDVTTLRVVVLFSHRLSVKTFRCFLRRVFLSVPLPLSLDHMPSKSGLNVFTCSIAPQAVTVWGFLPFFGVCFKPSG